MFFNRLPYRLSGCRFLLFAMRHAIMVFGHKQKQKEVMPMSKPMSKTISKPMSSQTPPVDFAVSQKIIHWLMAFLIMVDLIVAQKFGGAMELAERAATARAAPLSGWSCSACFYCGFICGGGLAHRPCPRACHTGKRCSPNSPLSGFIC
jgi:hypothetical protein